MSITTGQVLNSTGNEDFLQLVRIPTDHGIIPQAIRFSTDNFPNFTDNKNYSSSLNSSEAMSITTGQVLNSTGNEIFYRSCFNFYS